MDLLAFPGQDRAGRLWGVLQAGGPGYGVASSCHGYAQGERVPSVPRWWRTAITATCSSCLTLEVEFRQERSPFTAREISPFGAFPYTGFMTRASVLEHEKGSSC